MKTNSYFCLSVSDWISVASILVNLTLAIIIISSVNSVRKEIASGICISNDSPIDVNVTSDKPLSVDVTNLAGEELYIDSNMNGNFLGLKFSPPITGSLSALYPNQKTQALQINWGVVQGPQNELK